MKIIEDKSQWIHFSQNVICKKILQMIGWKLHFDGVPGTHGILIVYPHTSNMDFFICIVAKWAMGIPINFLAKDSLFKIPLVGGWLRYLGGRAVIRSSPQGYVSELASEMQSSKYFWLVITPEGTRKKTLGWRSGFYSLAHLTGYPIGFAFIDYAKKEIGVTRFAVLDGDEQSDMEFIQNEYFGKQGRFPESMAPIQLWKPENRKV